MYINLSITSIWQGLYQKAEVLYERGDLEQALILYNRGENLRPNLRGMFQAGIVKTKKAILSAIGGEHNHWIFSRVVRLWRIRGRGVDPVLTAILTLEDED